MKGKVEAIQAKIDMNSRKYEVNFIITIKKGLLYERSEQIISELRSEYLGKMVEITPTEMEQVVPYQLTSQTPISS